MTWSGWEIEENCHVLVNQFHVNIHSKTPRCRTITPVFRDVQWCFNASWGLKGLMSVVLRCGIIVQPVMPTIPSFSWAGVSSLLAAIHKSVVGMFIISSHCTSRFTFQHWRCIKSSFYIPENRLNFATTKGFRTKISMKLVYQYVVFFFNFKTTPNHFHPVQVENCDSNSRLVLDEDDNGKFRLERVESAITQQGSGDTLCNQ